MTVAAVASVKAGTVTASGARVEGVTANGIDITDRGGGECRRTCRWATHASGTEIGTLNIAGVRLSIRNRRIEGSTADIDAGTVKLGTVTRKM